MGDSYSQLAERFLAHYATLRGVVRQTLVDRQLAEHFGGLPARIADVGAVRATSPSLWLGGATR